MNSPIINPFYIYLLSISDKFMTLFTVITAISLGLVLIYLMFKVLDEDTTGIKWWIVKILSIIGGIALLFTLIIPPRDTMIQMYVASKVTPQLIKDAVITGKNFKDEIKKDIIDLLNYDKLDSTKSK